MHSRIESLEDYVVPSAKENFENLRRFALRYKARLRRLKSRFSPETRGIVGDPDNPGTVFLRYRLHMEMLSLMQVMSKLFPPQVYQSLHQFVKEIVEAIEAKYQPALVALYSDVVQNAVVELLSAGNEDQGRQTRSIERKLPAELQHLVQVEAPISNFY